MFEIFYKKNDNNKLFKYLEKSDFTNIQNYNPLYSRFFSLDEHNYNNINLNNRYSIHNVKEKISNNEYFIDVLDSKTNSKQSFKSFFKFSPLLDPVKFMVGKYKHIDNEKISSLPRIASNSCCKKVLDINNSAYVDGFFSYLSSKLLNQCGFIHGFHFFGSFLSIQNQFKMNIYDDIDYLFDSDFFHKNKDVLFKIDDIDEDRLLDSDTRNYRKKIKLDKNSNNINLECDVIDNDIFEGMFQELTCKNLKIHNSSLEEKYSIENKKNSEKSAKKTNSTCSSRSSNTNNKNDEEIDSNEYIESLTNSQMSDYSTLDSDEIINATIYNFPVQIICLEKLEDTLDSLLENDKIINNEEWKSCLLQVIMILITYQKVFNFTHNDLHTNNIMYVKTDKTFINYKFNNIYYKIPTFGKLYKIIDFGRAIYTFKGKTICSDSYHPKGDAATQYNFEPYFNENKPRLEPNKSFDLCRLGCSLYDFFVEDVRDEKKIKNPIAKLIIEWTKDDKGRNILYKNNGEERYPEFKLYKMIVRTVHNHTPEKQLDNILFRKFITTKKKIKKQKVINIDKMEPMI